MADGYCLLFPFGISSFILDGLVTWAQVRLSAFHCPALDAKQAYMYFPILFSSHTYCYIITVKQFCNFIRNLENLDSGITLALLLCPQHQNYKLNIA